MMSNIIYFNSRSLNQPNAPAQHRLLPSIRPLHASSPSSSHGNTSETTKLIHPSLPAPPLSFSSPSRHHLHICSSSLREYRLESTPQGPKKKLAFFVSGGGSNFKAIHAAILDGRIPHTEVSAVVSDLPSCGGIQYALDHGIPNLTYPIPKKGGYPGLTPEQLVTILKDELAVDYVILAGYLKLIPSALVAAFPNAMLNIHPGLLPSFGGKGMYGENVHKAVIASGARFSGPTVHFVSEEFDTGPILAQRVVHVYPRDTPKQLAARVLKEEHIVYPEAVAALVSDRVHWREDGIPMITQYM